MTKTDGSKYDPPRGVRLSDAANGQGLPCHDGNSASGGQSCQSGATDVSCKVTGNSATAHCANSAATVHAPHSHLDMVRCVCAVYGLDPWQEDAAAQGLAGHLDEVPVLLAVFADLAQLAAVDRDLERYSFAGGASVYPFAWNVLLAARAEGLGGVLTTMLIRQEDEVKRLLGADGSLALAAVIALGHPVHQPRRLRRNPVASFTTVDRVDGAPFPG